MIDLSTFLADALSDIVYRIHRSLVVLHNGKHGIGAGIIWSREGLVLTNYHVIAHGHNRVALANGEEYPTRLVAQDPEIDLALLEIEAKDLNPVAVADSRCLRVGQIVLAIGHPWGEQGVVTAGMISSLSKAQTRGPRGSVDVIRSDARLAPGNSGGPLVDASGAVVGINTMVIGGDQGIAIPSHVASDFFTQAMQDSPSTKAHQEKQPERVEQTL